MKIFTLSFTYLSIILILRSILLISIGKVSRHILSFPHHSTLWRYLLFSIIISIGKVGCYILSIRITECIGIGTWRSVLLLCIIIITIIGKVSRHVLSFLHERITIRFIRCGSIGIRILRSTFLFIISVGKVSCYILSFLLQRVAMRFIECSSSSGIRTFRIITLFSVIIIVIGKVSRYILSLLHQRITIRIIECIGFGR
mmetsp:Transcript_41224/g.46852  ORF Transcript_41224/g.46852 Transcript_41224/m.46852 type:complete len:200 (-) Transcript_41224:410-1009(-)